MTLIVTPGTGQTINTLDDLVATAGAATPAGKVLGAQDPTGKGLALAQNQGRSTTPSVPSLFTAATDTQALAVNTNRKRFSVYCDPNNLGTLYLLIGAGTCSATLMTIALRADGYYDFDTTDQIRGCFSSSGNTAYFQEHV